MKKALPIFLAVLVVLLMAVSSPASPAPVILTHTFTAPAANGATAVTFSVYVENTGDVPISHLTLSFVPSPPFIKGSPSFSAGDFAPHEKRNVAVKLATLAGIPLDVAADFSGLLFNVRYTDASGKSADFPAFSRLIRNGKMQGASLTAATEQTGRGAYLMQWGSKYHFRDPEGVAVDASGNIYVADTVGVIWKFDSSGNELASWAESQDGASYRPMGIAVDAIGNVYVTDVANQTVVKFDRNGTRLTTWESTGVSAGIVVDGGGSVFVADGVNGRINKFDGNGALIAAWDTPNISADRQFRPRGLALGPSGDLYAIDLVHRFIQKFDSSGNLLLTWSLAGYSQCMGIAADSTGKVYVTTSVEVQVYDSAGKFLTSWKLADTSSWPGGLAVDGNGIVYLAGAYNQRIEKFDGNGKLIAAWVSSGSENGLFNWPNDVALDRSGNVYVADTNNRRIQKFDANGNFLTAWGGDVSGNGQFNSPRGIAVDANGNVYVADFTDRVQKFDSNGTFISSLAYKWGHPVGPFGVAVDADFNIYVTYFGSIFVEKFDKNGLLLWHSQGCDSATPPEVGARRVAVDDDGNVYVTTAESSSVDKLDRDGNCINRLGSNYGYVMDIAGDRSGHLYVLSTGSTAYDNSPKVMVLDTSGTLLGGWGNYGTGNGQFIGPFGVAVDQAGSRVYVADTRDHHVEVFTGYGTTRFAISGPATATAGAPITFTVTALDAANEHSTGYTGTIHFSSSDASATLPANAALTSGTGTFTATFRSPGSQTIMVTDTETRSVTGTSNTIVVTAPKQVPDLTISKSHSSSFMKGHRGQYRITVRNSGRAATSGRVRVSDALPRGLTPTSIGGKGWTCTTRPLSCTTTRPLAAGASYPPITLIVTVNPNAPASVTNTATVSGGGEVNVSNDTARDTVKVKGHHK